MDRLEAYKQNIDLQHAVPFIAALFDVGDELPEGRGGFFAISSDTHASSIIYWYLKQEADIGRRGAILKETMKATASLYLPIRIAALVEKHNNDPEAFNVTDADLKELQQLCVEKIKQAANTGSLATHSKMLSILYRWREWGAPDELRRWVERLIESQKGVLSFLTACLQRSTSHGMGDYVSQEHWRINLQYIEDFVSIDVLEKQVPALSLDSLSEKETKAVKAFQKAIKRQQEGKSDDDCRDDEDE